MLRLLILCMSCACLIDPRPAPAEAPAPKKAKANKIAVKHHFIMLTPYLLHPSAGEAQSRKRRVPPRTSCWILASAEASHSGLPQISPPRRSA